MSWRARITDPNYRAPGAGRGVAGVRPRVPRPLAPGSRRDGAAGTASQANLRPPAQPGAGRGAGGARSATTVSRPPAVGRPPSAPALRDRPQRPLPRVAGGPGVQRPPPALAAGRPPRRPPIGPPPGGAGSRVAVTRARAVPAAAGPPAGTRPRSAVAGGRRGGPGAAPVNTSVAVRAPQRGPRGQAKITAVPVGPQSPPGAPPRARQIIIPAGTVNENETTVLDVPPVNALEQPQQVIIDPGTVHEEETTVVVVPAPRSVAGSPVQARRDSGLERERAAAEAAAAERERVRQSKIAFANYLAGRTDPNSQKMRHDLLMEADPEYFERHMPVNMDRFTEEELKGADELWDIDLDDVADPDEPALRLQMSMNIEEVPGRSPNTSFTERYSLPATPPAPPSPPRYTPPRSPTLSERMEQMGEEYGFLDGMEAPDSLYGEEASWEPPPPPSPPPPLIRSPVIDEPVVHISPPRYVYQRYAPHDPDDLMWDWEEPPRAVAEPVIEPEPESYSAELFRLVRF